MIARMTARADNRSLARMERPSSSRPRRRIAALANARSRQSRGTLLRDRFEEKSQRVTHATCDRNALQRGRKSWHPNAICTNRFGSKCQPGGHISLVLSGIGCNLPLLPHSIFGQAARRSCHAATPVATRPPTAELPIFIPGPWGHGKARRAELTRWQFTPDQQTGHAAPQPA